MGNTVNADAIDPCEEPGKKPSLKQHEIRICTACGAKFSATSENAFCPVCMLREVLAGGGESGESFSEDPGRVTNSALLVRVLAADLSERWFNLDSAVQATIFTKLPREMATAKGR